MKTNGLKQTLFLEGLEKKLEEILMQPGANGDPDDVNDLMKAVRSLCLGKSAKRIRPRLAHYFGSMTSASREAIQDIALAAELIHAATLLHDDVIDHGESRRGRPTANVVYGNHIAVLSGDLAISLSFKQLKSLTPEVTQAAIEMVGKMVSAVAREYKERGNADLDLEVWREIAKGKTGELFGWCGGACCIEAKDSDAYEVVEQCGRHLGIAFQLADDLRDIYGGDPGKNRFADIKNRNPSFPILYSAQQSDRVKNELGKLWQQQEIDLQDCQNLGQMMIENGAVEATINELDAEIERAFKCLTNLNERFEPDSFSEWSQLLKKNLPQTNNSVRA
jgi:geranylgeranyl pyrophosphate synthase